MNPEIETVLFEGFVLQYANLPSAYSASLTFRR